MPGGTEDDLLSRDGGVGDEVVVGGDDLVDVDEVFGLCWLSCACVHGHSVSRATGWISPFRCAKHWPFRGWDAVIGGAPCPTTTALWEGLPRGPSWKCRRSRAVGWARPVGAIPAACAAACAAGRWAGGGGLEAGGQRWARGPMGETRCPYTYTGSHSRMSMFARSASHSSARLTRLPMMSSEPRTVCGTFLNNV